MNGRPAVRRAVAITTAIVQLPQPSSEDRALANKRRSYLYTVRRRRRRRKWSVKKSLLTPPPPPSPWLLSCDEFYCRARR